ncbi:MAG: class I SAM-dependent methyltransferase, partial [Devosiaceae bacterium]|nr:class I SAM-dependent methyltransferase [Devosiaceae bacterium MH13]
MSNDYEAAQTVLQPLSGHVGPGAAERLTVYAKLLRRWQQTHNLMGPEALDRLWNRHMTDSLTALPVIDSALQLTAGAAHAPAWLGLDLGSGAGFPGLALALSTA